MSSSKITEMAKALRFLSIDMVEKAKSGHPGLPMGVADIIATLYNNHMRFDSKQPQWENRDRFILSAGHGSAILYSLLYLSGYPDIDLEDLKQFRQLNSKTAGHPEYGHLSGIEMTTGPLGQGIATSVGMAVAQKIRQEKFGAELFDHNIYVLAGDGCLMEGISQEAISWAGHLGLNKLIVFWDDNGITIDGSTDIATSENQKQRFEACNWKVIEIDGHNIAEIDAAITIARNSDKPTLIACKTIIGYGSPNKSGTCGVHGAPLGKEEVKLIRKALNWEYEDFQVPEKIINDWRSLSIKNEFLINDWKLKFSRLDEEKLYEFNRTINKELPKNTSQVIGEYKKKLSKEKPNIASRKSSQVILEELCEHIPELIGGTADLTHSNLTQVKSTPSILKDNFTGRHLHYGVREHMMAAAMNGIDIYGGLKVYGGTFLVFADYMRGAIRLAALMGTSVTYVLTHDSIGVGEDGPTHQPVETLASLRAIPNLKVFRPADAIETLEAWEIALNSSNSPSALALTRQNLPLIRSYSEENKVASGGYIIQKGYSEHRQVTLIATGSEVSLAIESANELNEQGISTTVVSMPCFKLFDKQSQEYKQKVLGTQGIRIGIEAALDFGWHKYLDTKQLFIGMNSFGTSGPAPQVFEKFNITKDEIIKVAKQNI